MHIHAYNMTGDIDNVETYLTLDEMKINFKTSFN